MTKCLRGAAGWMYLDNDTNGTWDQYAGRLLISADNLRAWQQELDDRATLLQQLGIPYRLVIAPNKESVVPDYLPSGYQRAAVTPFTQLQTILAGYGFYLDVLTAMTNHPERQKFYIKTDTHWNDYGGLVVARAVIASLPKLFGDSDLLDERHVLSKLCEGLGDLGDKCDPIVKEMIEFRDFNKRQSRLVYANHLVNHGSVEIFEGGADNGLCCVVFGDSFSGRVNHWLRECVSRLVCLHTSSIDASVLRHEQPDFVVSVSVERFILRPPQSCTSYHLQSDVAGKLTRQPAGEPRRQAPFAARDRFYHDMLGDPAMETSEI